MILSVNKNLDDFEKIDAESFAKLNIWERKHIQEWIRNAPEILGEELLVLSIEFDRFEQSNDRLDILALDRFGNIVVIELKRDSYAGYADLQAIRYAAMVSSLTIDSVLPYYLAYQKKHLDALHSDEEASATAITEFVIDDNFTELSNSPRIILCSEDFSPEITTTVLWLNENGLDISCVRITPHDMGERIAIVPNKIIPLKEAAQYLIDIKKKERSEAKSRKNRPRSMKIIAENGLLEIGQPIYLRNGLPNHLQFTEGDNSFIAEFTGKAGQSNAVRWMKDGSEYSISGLTWMLFKETHPDKKDPGGINGSWHWETADGKNLWAIADEFYINNLKH